MYVRPYVEDSILQVFPVTSRLRHQTQDRNSAGDWDGNRGSEENCEGAENCGGEEEDRGSEEDSECLENSGGQEGEEGNIDNTKINTTLTSTDDTKISKQISTRSMN